MNVRTLNFINQLKKSFIYKIIGVIISFFLIRLMIQYLGIEMYGIWVVILTFINWIIFFDFGITNGIKNKLTEALSNNDYELSKEYISTGYVILFILFFILFFIFLIVSYFINWQLIFNTTILDNTLLKNTLFLHTLKQKNE
jgi:O-antigen/teichoic acid export membrane protein